MYIHLPVLGRGTAGGVTGRAGGVTGRAGAAAGRAGGVTGRLGRERPPGRSTAGL